MAPLGVLGGMGVLLFFFVSGYGIQKSYFSKKPTMVFWKKRICNMFIPAFLVCLLSVVISNIKSLSVLGFAQIIKETMLMQWFVLAIMLEYLLFFVGWLLSYKIKKKYIEFITVFVGNIGLTVYFILVGANPRWYSGLMVFLAGMLVAGFEQRILSLKKKQHIAGGIVSILAFGVMGILFNMLKAAFWSTILKSLAGIFLAMFFVSAVLLFKVGNKAANWVGERSLYIYLCHLGILQIIGALLWDNSIINTRWYIAIWIMIVGTPLYAAIMHWIFGTLLSRKKS
ncbi:MAG: acyltransferase [Lachnospiraceae bacterium]|nr:acyltransferase [Lachnospiraceae bacterium]